MGHEDREAFLHPLWRHWQCFSMQMPWSYFISISLLWYLCFCIHNMSILCPGEDVVSSGSWLILFKVLTSSVTSSTLILHLSYFSLRLSLSSVADFSNIGARSTTPAERVSCLSAWKMMRFGEMVWVRISWWHYFYLNNRRHPYRWVNVVSWLNYLILVVDCRVIPPCIKWSLPLTKVFIHLTSYPLCHFPWLLMFNL